MAARVAIEGGDVVLHIEGLHKFMALKSTLRIPLAHISGVTARPEVKMGWNQEGIRAPGTSIPGVVRAGSFYLLGDGWHFYDLNDPQKAIAIDLNDEHYKRVVVQVDGETPEAAAERIRAAMA